MVLLKKLARRIVPRTYVQPPAPVEARDAYRSMIFSADDLKPAPSERLLRVGLEAVRRVVEGEVDLSDIAARPTVPQWYSVWPGEHYQLLGGMMLTLKPRTVIEIGTFSGLSALTLRKFLRPEGKINTFDVVPWRNIPDTALTDADFADGRLEQKLENLSDWNMIEKNRELLESADFLFIDAPKDGVFEYRLFEHFQKLHFRNKPIALLDDTRLWSMLKFWRIVPWPKLDLTSFGSWSGTGLVDLSVPAVPAA